MGTRTKTPTSNILGATGPSKRALGAYFLQAGLFGNSPPAVLPLSAVRTPTPLSAAA
jgi:hypothetical protein